MTLIAIDPGWSGGIASIVDGAPPETQQMGGDAYEISLQLSKLRNGAGDPVICFLEQVGGYIGKAQPGSSAFKFGRNVGILEGIAIALHFEIRWVRPQTWQKSLSALSRPGEEKSAHKRRLKTLAVERYPQLRQKITLGNCDALLILSYAREATK